MGKLWSPFLAWANNTTCKEHPNYLGLSNILKQQWCLFVCVDSA